MAATTRSEPALELIVQARTGDERAFAELVTPYRAALFSLLVNELRDRLDAEEVMQDVLFLVWRGLPGYEHHGRFGGWLFTIAYRALASHRRKYRPEFVDAEGAVERSSMITPHLELEASDLNDRILAAVAALPERQRDVFRLRQTSDMTFAEIAEALHEPLNTVLSHMNYATQKIRRVVSDI